MLCMVTVVWSIPRQCPLDPRLKALWCGLSAMWNSVSVATQLSCGMELHVHCDTGARQGHKALGSGTVPSISGGG